MVGRDGFDVSRRFEAALRRCPQVYSGRRGEKTRRLFSHGGDISSDRDLHEREREAAPVEPDPGNVLYLDATIYRGNEVGKRRINNQHKIGDKRNSAKNTFINLPDEQRRARIEITLTSFEALEQAGAENRRRPKRIQLQNPAPGLPRLALPTCAPEAEDVERTIAQMTTRGRIQRRVEPARACLDERAQKKKKPPRPPADLTGQLVDWPEYEPTRSLRARRTPQEVAQVLKMCWERRRRGGATTRSDPGGCGAALVLLSSSSPQRPASSYRGEGRVRGRVRWVPVSSSPILGSGGQRGQYGADPTSHGLQDARTATNGPRSAGH